MISSIREGGREENQSNELIEGCPDKEMKKLSTVCQRTKQGEALKDKTERIIS